MEELIVAAEAALGALESYKDRKEGNGENVDGLVSISDYLKEQVNKIKATVKVGDYQLKSYDLYRRIVDKIPSEQFDSILKEIEADLNAGTESGPVLSDKLKTLIIQGLKVTGSYDGAILYIEEELTPAELSTVEGFFEYLKKKKLTIGHGNIIQRFKAWKKTV